MPHGRTICETQIAGTTVPYIEEDDTIRERFESGWHEEELLWRITEAAASGDTFWDIGACIGVHSFVAEPYYENVVAFEPVGTNVATMTDNCAVNGMFGTIEIRKQAVADDNRETTIAIRESQQAGFGRHSLEPQESIYEYDVLREDTVEVVTGDTVAAESGVPATIKIDVEGAEGLVLDGMPDTLAHKDCRNVFVETHEPNPNQPSYHDFGYSASDIYEMLMEAGFSIEYCDKEYLIHARK